MELYFFNFNKVWKELNRLILETFNILFIYDCSERYQVRSISPRKTQTSVCGPKWGMMVCEGPYWFGIPFMSFPGSSDGKASAYNVGDPGSIPGSGRSPGERNDNPLQYSCLKNSMDGGTW